MKEKNETKKQKTSSHKKMRGAIVGLSMATGILALSTVGLGIGYGITSSNAETNATQLENVYKRNYYELVDSVNTAENNINKLLVSDDESYQAKMLGLVAQGSKDMQNNIATLPLTNNNVTESVQFINQMSGYTQTLEENLAKGGSLSAEDLQTLDNLQTSLKEMKDYLNQMSKKMLEGYNILGASRKLQGDYTDFSLDFAQIKADDTEYPSMIFDGPFSDSVVNQSVKGLRSAEISQDQAEEIIRSKFDNIVTLDYVGETNGRFKTFNFEVTNADGQEMYVQSTKQGGKLLTISGNVKSQTSAIEIEKAEKIATDFAKANGVENAIVVWREVLASQAYFNITPVQDGIVLYPDLVKVKVDLQSGNVIGYDSMSYWLNHRDRKLPQATVSVETAKKHIDSSFEVVMDRLVVAPLDFGREELCIEFEATKDGDTYYFYINALTNVEENILKVLKTSDSSKLM